MARRFFNITSALNAVVNADDHAAFEFLYNAFYNKLMRVALYYLGKELLAEDALSDVFFKLWQNRQKLKKVRNLDNYLFTMTKNQCLYVIRSDKKVIYNDKMMDDHLGIVIDNPESNMISEEFVNFFNAKIQELPPRCKLIYLMVKEDGLKYREVADILNISNKTVENQMTKAIAHIREFLNLYKSHHSHFDRSENL